MNHSQKNYIKKHIKNTSSEEISKHLNLSVGEVEEYVKKRWGKERLAFYQNQKNSAEIKQLHNISLFHFLKYNWVLLGFLTFIVFLAYATSLGNQFVSDDLPSIVNNKQLPNFNYIIAGPSQMVRPFLYFLAFQLGGINPIAFHLINTLFHLGTVLTVYCIVYLIYNKKIALISSLLFAVHPLLTEAVTWVSGGTYSQAAFFSMASLTMYVLFRKKSEYSSKTNIYLYFAALLFFVLALSSQATPVVLPIILLTYEFCFGNIRKNWKLAIPFFLLTFGQIVITVPGISERHNTLATVNYVEQGYNNPFLELPVSITSYLQLFFLPTGLTLYHSEVAVSLVEFVIRSVVLIILALFWVRSYFKHKLFFFWSTFFLVSLVPTLVPSFFKLTWILAERYIYFGVIPLCVIAAMGISDLSDRPKIGKFTYPLFSLIIIALLVRTIVRNSDWQDQDHLWIAASYTSPSSPNNHNNLGDMYGRHGDKQAAIREFQTAIALKPNYADAYHNLANTYQEIGDSNKALENYQKALEINPNLWQSYQNIAAIYFALGKTEQAAQILKNGLKNNPANPNLENGLGIIYLKLNDPLKAKQAFTQVLSQDPTNQIAQQGLALTNK